MNREIKITFYNETDTCVLRDKDFHGNAYREYIKKKWTGKWICANCYISIRRYGTADNKTIQQIKNGYNRKTYTDEQLLKELVRYEKENGKRPTKTDFDNNHKYPSSTLYYRRFGNWKTALERAFGKYEEQREKIYTDKDLLDFLIFFNDKTGEIPTKTAFDDNYEYPSSTTYYRRFGSWSNALRLVGLDVDTVTKKGCLKTTNEKSRLSEIVVSDHFKTYSVDLAGGNHNSPYDGICPNGKLYEVKSSKLYKGLYWYFATNNRYKEDIEIYYFLAFNENYTELVHAWRVPGEIIDNNGLYIAPNSWSRAKFTVDNMKEYRIMDNNIIKTLVNYGIKYWRKTMETKTALITGITGQDGSFLAELLLDKGYDVHGLIRRLSKPNLGNIEHIIDDIHLIDGDLSDQSSIINAVTKSCPDELYNLAAQSFVATSWQQAEYTCNISGFGAFRVYDASRMVGKYIKGEDPKHNIKIYQASSSEMYGDSPAPQNELTQFNPRSPYGAAKVFAHNMAKVYRDSYNMFITCGILFNHESQRRGIEFVSMKIANAAARIDAGLQDKLKLGNLDAKRDWGYTKDYVEAMYLMMQQEKPDNFVIASGENHTIREFVDEAFSHVGLKWHDYVEIDKSLFRPAEIDDLRGDYSKAEKTFGWKPKTSFKELIHIMVDSEINKITGTK